MKANEFIKKFGWDEVISELNKTQDNVVVMWLGSQSNDFALVKDLKHLVESYKLVEFYGGLEEAKTYCPLAKYVVMEYYYKLKQAIEDVESCL